jgi:carboxymethylenebutenolidase
MANRMALEAAVLYYGTSEVSDRWGCPVLAHWAETDEWEPADEVTAFVGSLEGAGADVDSNVYEGTGHWFANSDVPSAYDPRAASLAFERTVDFLHQNLA